LCGLRADVGSERSAAQLSPSFYRIYGAARIAGFIKKICGPEIAISKTQGR
jgi:hypothetical protein